MKKKPTFISASSRMVFVAIVGLSSVGLSGAANAQDPPAEATPPATTTTTPAATSTTTGAGAGLGVGAAAFVTGLTGAQVVYDMPLWHIEGLLGFDSRELGGGANPPTVTTFAFGASGWYHLHMGSNSDFSLGGGIGFVNASGGGESFNGTVIEPGAMARAFVTPNVAVHGRIGVSMVFGDNVGPLTNHIGLGAHMAGAFGFTYFLR